MVQPTECNWVFMMFYEITFDLQTATVHNKREGDRGERLQVKRRENERSFLVQFLGFLSVKQYSHIELSELKHTYTPSENSVPTFNG